jgi:ribose transport system substrate-binding protein
MGMIQNVPTHDVDAIIFGSDDGFAAAPLLKQVVDRGVAVLTIPGDHGDTSGLEEIAVGSFAATFKTAPVLMGQAAMHATLDPLSHEFAGGWTEVPTEIVDADTVVSVLQQPEKLHPLPSKPS